MDELKSSVQQLEAVLSNPTEAYAFVSSHGKNPQIISPLVQILVNPDYELNSPLRTQAVIMIRNGLDSWYRRLSPNKIGDQEKVQLGQVLVEKILARGERDPVIRKQVALCIGKIGKSNLDGNLDNLVVTLTGHISNVLSQPGWDQDPMNYQILNGCLAGFYQIIQNLISNRSAKGQLLLREVATSHFAHIYQVYSSTFSTWTSILGQQTTLNLSNVFHSQSVIELSRICLKILGQLSIYAWKSPCNEELPRGFIKQSIHHWTTTFETRKKMIEMISIHKNILNNQSTSKSIESFFNLLNKHLFKFGKILIENLNQNIGYLELLEFREFLKQTIWEVIKQGSLNFENARDYPLVCLVPYPERIIIQCLRIMSLVLTGHPSSSDALSANQSIELAQVLLTKLLILPQHSLQFWSEDPESFENEDVNLMESIYFDVRSCAANVMYKLVAKFPKEIVGVIFDLYSAIQSQGLNNLPSLLQFESIYYGMGIAASQILTHLPASVFNFQSWVEEKFMPVLCQTDPEGRIVRRRIAWLLGEFTKEDFKPEIQNSIYLAIKCVLENPGNDVATKLAACRALGSSTSWEVTDPSKDHIRPYIPDFVRYTSVLFDEVENLDSQKVLTVTLGKVIEKSSVNIKPYAGGLVQIMATLWQQVTESSSKSNSGNHLHNSILVTMSALVRAMGSDSQEHHQSLAIFIQYSIDPSNPSSVYLRDDGLVLWLDLIEESESMTPSLGALLPILNILIKEGNDSLCSLLEIFRAYVLLDVTVTLNVIGREVSMSFSSFTDADDLPVEILKSILSSIEVVVECCKSSDQVEAWFGSSDCFKKLIQRSILNEGHHIKVSEYVLLVCKIIVKDVGRFLKILSDQTGSLFEECLTGFCRAILDRIDNIGNAQDRKLVGCSISYLISTKNLIVFKFLEGFVSVLSSVLSEGDEVWDEKSLVYRYTFENEYDFNVESNHVKRQKTLLMNDPIRMKRLNEIINENLNSGEGGLIIIKALNENVEGFILDEFKRRLSGELKG